MPRCPTPTPPLLAQSMLLALPWASPCASLHLPAPVHIPVPIMAHDPVAHHRTHPPLLLVRACAPVTGGPNTLLGDALVLLGASIYAACNVAQVGPAQGEGRGSGKVVPALYCLPTAGAHRPCLWCIVYIQHASQLKPTLALFLGA